LAWRSGFSGGATDLAHHRSITPPHSRVLRLSSNDALLRYEPVARGAPPQFGKTAVTTRDEAYAAMISDGTVADHPGSFGDRRTSGKSAALELQGDLR